MSPQIPALPVAAVPQPTIVWPRNPFHPADKDLFPVQPGSTVADWMQATLAGKSFPSERWFVKSSGEVVKTRF